MNYIQNLEEQLKLYKDCKPGKQKEIYAERITNMLSKINLHFENINDHETLNVIKDMATQFNNDQILSKIEEDNNIKIGFFKKHKKKLALTATSLLLAATVISCSSNKNTKEINKTNIVETDKAFDQNKFTKHPLTEKTQTEVGTAWGQWAADNGLLDKENGTDRYTLAAIATTFNSGNADSDKFVDELALGKNFANHESIKATVDSMRADHEQVLLAKKSIDYTNLLTRKNSIKLLNEFNNVWTNSSVNPTSEQINNFDELFTDFIMDKDNYDPFTIFLVNDYVTMATESGLTPFENSAVFAKALDECCEKSNGCSIDVIQKELSAANTIESKSSVLLYGSFESLRNDKEHVHTEAEAYSSYDEINNKVSEKVSAMTNNENIDLVEEAIKQSEEMAHAKVDRTYGVKNPVLPTDKIQPNGTIDSGKTTVENNVGDKTTEVEKDMSGDEKAPDYDTMWNLGWNDYILSASNKPLANGSLKGNKGYDDGWNMAEENSVKFDGSESTTEKDEIKDIPADQNPVAPNPIPEQTPSAPEQTPTAPDKAPSEPTIPEEDIVNKDEEIIYDENFFDEYELGPDGIYYPKAVDSGVKTR